ncbi:hypothetical protein L1994_10705 [Methanomicrobium antiquum]|uniref:Uncharacterized protein n=1 Tax=Methanomicrobium antiquum TaxID=487686 RepID=A0AAF0JMJ1_9EURY|nr:hypothetical protein [Methanomicrobium antiquum]MDD3978295.1 hypothetical protein [Methanomicrobium sp.]WFN36595.1 hypothetical protein L1994_10705 [Methanomicrobium antiquum]
MNTKLTGIFTEGDTRDFKEWLDKQLKSASDRNNEIPDIKTEISLLRQTIERMEKKIDNIEHILEKVSE